MFLGKVVPKICRKSTGVHSCLSVISIKLKKNFVEITHRYDCSPVNLLHIFRTLFRKNISGRLFLIFEILWNWASYTGEKKGREKKIFLAWNFWATFLYLLKVLCHVVLNEYYSSVIVLTSLALKGCLVSYNLQFYI